MRGSYVSWEPPALFINRESSLQKLPPPQLHILMKFRIFYRTCEHTCGLVATGTPATPSRGWAGVSRPLPQPRGGGTWLVQGFPREQNSTLITYNGFTMDFDIWLASVPTVLFLKLPNYSWVFYTNCRNRLKPSVWNLGWILVQISSNSWINFRERWCLHGLNLSTEVPFFSVFLRSEWADSFHAPSQPLSDKACLVLDALWGFLVCVDVVTEGSFPATFSRRTPCVRLPVSSNTPVKPSAFLATSHRSSLSNGSSGRRASWRSHLILLGFLPINIHCKEWQLFSFLFELSFPEFLFLTFVLPATPG